MTCTWRSRWLFSALLFACGDDDGGDVDDGADDSDSTPASDDFAPGEDDASASNDDGGTTGGTAADDAADAASADDAAEAPSSSSSGADDGASGCIEAGGACTTANFCSTWICVCNAGATEFMTVGSCDSGVCSTDGTTVCDPICANSGGVAMATDAGCG